MSLRTAILFPLILLGSATCQAGQPGFVIDRPKQLDPRDEISIGPLDVDVDDRVNLPLTRAIYGLTGKGLAAAVIDTGLRTTHRDFRGRIVAQHNFCEPDPPGDVSDTWGHGTHVTGILAANGGAGPGPHLGVAPEAKLIVLKVFSQTSPSPTTQEALKRINNALAWVLEHHKEHTIAVVCMSLGLTDLNIKDVGGVEQLPQSWQAELTRGALLIRQLTEAGVTVVAAGGNSYCAVTRPNGPPAPGMTFPAIVPQTISVGAMYTKTLDTKLSYGTCAALKISADQITPFSQRLSDSDGANSSTDVFAPGAPVQATGINSDEGTALHWGTSQAAPIIAGTVLLMQEYHRQKTGKLATPAQIETWIRASSPTFMDSCQGCDTVPRTNSTYRRLDTLVTIEFMKRTLSVDGPVERSPLENLKAKIRLLNNP